MDSIEARLLEAVTKLVGRKYAKLDVAEGRGATRFRLHATGFDAVVVYQPGQWIGLDIRFRLPNTELYYSVDSDLYPISEPDFQDMVESTVVDITNILTFITEKRIPAGDVQGRPAVLVPEGSGYKRIEKRRFSMVAKSYRTIEEGLAGATWSDYDFVVGRKVNDMRTKMTTEQAEPTTDSLSGDGDVPERR
ncbi:hypothetical protein FB566_2041 [Stackebrandtia endophytica]|uniref:Uncharacterized protein n=1 Tax=Stackebrandtia endophytica TaxID=1496996 RepID=A0A543AVA2_9ACTN|nr:hypothetical protein [Stackebrandtia endophytica]TQL76509.1 hypothetical protein FB566_2041 [Stackebrandtia endophytica]